MSETTPPQPPGWYYAQGDPPGTQRYWDGSQWQGGPQPAPGSAPAGPGMATGDPQGGLASPGKRILARIVDWVIWIVVSLIIGAIFGGSVAVGTDASGASLVAGVLSTLLFVAYEVWFTANKGGTPGKLVLGIRVADQATRNTPIDYQQAFMRTLPLLIGIIPILGIVVFLIAVASLVLLFVDSQRQTVWDKIAKTVVVEA